MSHFSESKDRSDLIKDAEYFLSEAMKRLEALGKTDIGKMVPVWQQMAGNARKMRGICRVQNDRQRQRRTQRRTQLKAQHG